MKRCFFNILLNAICFFYLIPGCSEKFSDNPHPNQPPETYISVFSNSDLNPTISQRTIHWWGDDPDGIVVGYIYTFVENAENVSDWDSTAPNLDWTFTQKTSQNFTLKLSGADTLYTLRVKAIDDLGAVDLSPAIQKFPVINSIPSVKFPLGTDVPETTFTVATFLWSGSDPDGADNIDKYQYVLDDTTNDEAWIDLDHNVKSITLTASEALTEGNHIFFLRVIDIAGAISPVIRMPRDQNDVWYVREPKSKFLIIDDYNIANDTDDFYKNTLSPLVGTFDVWDIKSNGKAQEPPSAIAFYTTLLLFDKIFWYSDAEFNFEKAQVSIPKFLDAGGKIIISNAFQEFSSNQGDPLDFSPVDSLGSRISRITRGQAVLPTINYSNMGFPELKVNTAIIPNVYPLVPKENAVIFYQLSENSSRWPGTTPPIAIIDSEASFVFFGLPLANLNGNNSVSLVFEKILNEIF